MGVTFQPGALQEGFLEPSGVVPGSYDAANISVNAQGFVVAAANGAGGGGAVGTGTTFSGTNVSGSMSLGAAGLDLALSVAAVAGVPVNFSAGTTSNNLASVVFGDSNGLNWGLSGSTITASYTVPSVPPQTSLSFSNLNGVSFGIAGSTLTASVAAQSVQTQASGAIAGTGFSYAGAQISGSGTLNTAGLSLSLSGPVETGVGISAAGSSQSNGVVVFSNSNGLAFGMNGSTVTGSYTTPAQTNQTEGLYALGNTTGQSSSSTFDARTQSVSGAGEISVGFSANAMIISAPPSSIGVSTGGGTVGNTGTYSGQVVFAGINNITLSVSSAAGGAQTITISGPTVGGAQTGISALVVSNTTYTSGTVTLQNANGISFGSSGANGISASYTVPTQTNQSLAVYASSQTFGQSSSSTYDARSLSLVGSGGVSVGWSAGSLLVSGTTYPAQSAQPVAVSGSNGSFAFSTLTLGDLNGLSFYTTNGSVAGSYTVPSVAGLLSAVNVSAGTTSNNLSAFTLSNSNGISFGLNASTITASYTVPTQSNQTAGVYASSQTFGQSSSSTYDARSLTIVGSGNVSVGWSNSSLLISGAAGAAQTGISGVQVSNTTYTSGTITLQNANGISFGSSGANGISASYTVPTVPALSFGVSTGGNTSGNTGTYSGQVVLAGGNNITLSVSSAAGGAQTITISAPNAPAAQTGISGLQVSNTTYTSGTVTFQNANGISFGSSGANGLSASYTVPTQTNQTVGVYGSSQTTGSASSYTYDARSLSLIGAGAISIGNNSTSAGGTTTGIIISAPVQTVQTQASGAIAGTGFSYAGANVSGSGTLNTAGLSLSLSAAAVVTADSIYLQGNTTSSSSGSLPLSSFAVSALGAAIAGFSSGGSALIISGATGTTFNGGNISGSLTLNSAGLDLSLSVAGPGGAASETFYAQGNTTVSSSGSIALSSYGISGLGAASVGFSSGGSALIISVPVQSAQTIGLYFMDQTTGASSSSTIDARSMSFTFGGAMSGGMTGGTVELSVPPVTSLVGVNGISLSSNGSTISISNILSSTSYLPYEFGNFITTTTTFGPQAATSGNVFFFPVSIYNSVSITFDCLNLLGSASAVTQTSNGSATHSTLFGLYSLNGASLSLISSNSYSVQVSGSSRTATYSYPYAWGTAGYSYTSANPTTTANMQSSFGTYGNKVSPLQLLGTFSASRGVSFWLGLLQLCSTANSNVAQSTGAIVFPLLSAIGVPLGVNPSASNSTFGGVATASTAGMPASISTGAISWTVPAYPVLTLISN